MIKSAFINTILRKRTNAQGVATGAVKNYSNIIENSHVIGVDEVETS